MRAAIAVIFLAGCATAPVEVPVIVHKTVEVKVPVPVPCVAKLPGFPDLPTDAALASMDDYRLVLTIEMLRRDLTAYAERAQALLTACAQPRL